MSGREVPLETRRRQRLAADPVRSVWVSANAGSGKTFVLARRVARLLLAGTPPARILCLTFTKAAAATMANRVFAALAQWATADDAALDAILDEVDGERASPARRAAARRLFATALETPGGLKIDTIHGFCTRILQQFPVEAGVPAHFAVIEDRERAVVLERIKAELRIDADRRPETPVAEALARLGARGADETVDKLIDEAIGKREAYAAWLGEAGGIGGIDADLGALLDLPEGVTAASVEADILAGAAFSLPEAASVADALESIGGATNGKTAARFRAYAAARDSESYRAIFAKGDGEVRAAGPSFATKAFNERFPHLSARISAEIERLAGLIDLERAVEIRDLSHALAVVMGSVERRYAFAKRAGGLLDFDDLIARVRALLATDAVRWVHYKIDGGIDHVLIDEAQDTSPAQWDIVRALVSEFTAGAGARREARTIFAVGDEKQSIYSFQGAEPRLFGAMRAEFERDFTAAGADFSAVPLNFSFRSAPAILSMVDEVFADAEAARGLSFDGAPPPRHEAIRRDAPGRVEIWDKVAVEAREKPSAWKNPFDFYDEDDARIVLARRLADRLAAMIGRAGLPSGARTLRAGDVLILVRTRGALFDAIIRALKARGVAVAGADRMRLGEHIAVMDLLALADALLMPADDLALATILKSPLFGLDEEALMALAAHRKGTLRQALDEAAEPRLASIAETLRRWTREAAALDPFAFYSRLLGRDGLRARFFARLGEEAADALDLFLEAARNFAQAQPGTLAGFARWLRADSSDVKRDMDVARDEVRVMTVHGAKGLEAPLVILADTLSPPTGAGDPKLFAIEVPGRGHPALLYSPAKGRDAGPVIAARSRVAAAREEEYRRLLYVALTRAEDMAWIAGAVPGKPSTAPSWYDMVRAALEPGAEPFAEGEVTGLLWRRGPEAPAPAALVPPPAAIADEDRPAWLAPLRRPADIAPARVAPSRFPAVPKPLGDDPARRRGLLVHALLQALGDAPLLERQAVAGRLLARQKDLSPHAATALLAEVMAVFDTAEAAALFAPGSRAEVPLVGRLARADGSFLEVSGRIDRLAVAPDAVRIVDFKTDRRPPPRGAALPAAYVTQLALYRALLIPLFPGRRVEAAILWTAAPRLDVIETAALDAAVSQALRA